MGKHSKWSKIDQDDFADFYLTHSCNDIMNRYEIERKTIQRWARNLNLPRKNRAASDHPGLRLSQRQIDITNGMLLGDASSLKVSATTNSSLHVAHSDKQKDWAAWKMECLKPFMRDMISDLSIGRKRAKDGKIVNDDTKTYTRHRCYTMNHTEFTDLEILWYKRDANGNYCLKQFGEKFCRIKVLPSNFILSKLSLVVWFLDDGHNKIKSRRHELYTLAFEKDEVERLVQATVDLGLVNCHSESYHRGGSFVVIHGQSYSHLVDMVKKELPDLPQCMSYKIKEVDHG